MTVFSQAMVKCLQIPNRLDLSMEIDNKYTDVAKHQ